MKRECPCGWEIGTCLGSDQSGHEGHPSSETLSHAAGDAGRLDDPNLVSLAGLVPTMALAEAAGLQGLADEHLSVPSDKGANAGLKVASLVGGMVAGADSIDDMALLRHGGMGRVFSAAYAPSTLGSFLREFRFGHVRQLDAVASRFLAGLAARAPLLPAAAEPSGTVANWAVLDMDDTVVEVHGYAKQGAGFGYNRIRGLNALIATLSTPTGAPVIVAQRLRKGSTSSPRGAKRLVADAARTASRLLPPGTPVLLRADSAFYGRPTLSAALTGGAQVSVTVRLDPRVKAAISSIGADAWTRIEYPHPVWDEAGQQWVSRAEVAETSYTAFSSKPKPEQVAGRLVVRRIPDLNPPTRPGRALCSTLGATTPSSPPPTPPCSTPSPPTRFTAATRSSSKSTPTSKPPPWPTCPRECSPRTPPGSCVR